MTTHLNPSSQPRRAPNDRFGRFAAWASFWLGSKWGFAGASIVIAAWVLSGPVFEFSDSWQLVINTATTVVTFLMVFLIQNTQNRDARAINLKLDELIRATDQAGNQMIDIENLSDQELEDLHKQYESIRAELDKRQKNQPGHSVAGHGRNLHKSTS